MATGDHDMTTPELPPYIYGREAGPNEKVWTEAAVRAALAARGPLTEPEIDALYEANCEPSNPFAPSRKFFGRTVRATEIRHGITPKEA